MKSLIIQKLKKIAEKYGVIPPNEMFADNCVHSFDDRGQMCSYILDNKPPEAGMLKLTGIKGIKKVSIISDKMLDKLELDEKFSAMKQRLRIYKQPEEKGASNTRFNPPIETDESIIEWLASMTIFDYDRVRKSEASKLRIRVSVLDKAVDKVRKSMLSCKAFSSNGQLKLDL